MKKLLKITMSLILSVLFMCFTACTFIVSSDSNSDNSSLNSENDSSSGIDSENESSGDQTEQTPELRVVSGGVVYELIHGIKYQVTGYENPNKIIKIADEISDIPVTDIMAKAFIRCDKIEEVQMGKNIKTIGHHAFSYCSLLRKVNLNEGLNEIGDRAFCNCPNIEETAIPASVVNKGKQLFDMVDEEGEVIDYLFSACEKECRDNFKEDYDITPDFIVPEGGYNGKPVEITFLSSMRGDLSMLIKEAITEFNKIYPNITINLDSIGDYTSIYNSIEGAMKKDCELPDISYCYPDHVAQYNTYNKVIPLDNLINDKNIGLSESEKGDFIKGFYDQCKIMPDNKMYSIPFSKSTDIFYYNKTFFEQFSLSVPKTWDELFDVCKKIKKIKPDCYPIACDSEENLFLTLCKQFDISCTSAYGEHFLFNNEKAKSIVRNFRKMFQNGYVITQKSYGGYTSPCFAYGKSVMAIGSSAGSDFYKAQKINDEPAFEVGVTPILQASTDKLETIIQGPNLCILNNKNEQKVVASWLFVKYITTNTKLQADFSMKSGYIPVVKSAYEMPIYKNFILNADGYSNLNALSAKVCSSLSEKYFTLPVFPGSEVTRQSLGNLLYNCMKFELEY